jgi:hypothetical protein
MLNEPVLSEVEGVKHLAIAREILRGVYPRAKRRTQNDIVHHLTCDRAIVFLEDCPSEFTDYLLLGWGWRRSSCSGHCHNTGRTAC